MTNINTMLAAAVLMAAAILVYDAGAVPVQYPIVVPATKGSNAITPVDAYSVIEAETVYSGPILVGQWLTFEAVYEIQNGEAILYRQVDFGTGPTMVSVDYASRDLTAGETVQIHWVLDSATGTPFHTTTIGYTGPDVYKQLTALELMHCPEVTGVHDLYLRFENDRPDYGDVMLIDWFQFYQFA